jgi:hypothetical protein
MSESKENNKEPIYVIGFPKSGNTWLARLLAEITQSKIEASNTVDVADNSATRRGVHLIFKIHDSVKEFSLEEVPIIYIVRDVRDVLVSAFFFNNGFVAEDLVKVDSNLRGIKRLLYRLYFWNQIRRMNRRWCGNELSVLNSWIHGRKNTVGSWSEHVESWVKDSRVVVVKYEDLLCDAVGELKKILGFLEIDVDDGILEEAILNQSFKKKKSKFMDAGDSRNVKFLRSGKQGGWREFLSPAMAKEIEKTHADVMRNFDYKLEYYKGAK